jgi:general stress protein YciG
MPNNNPSGNNQYTRRRQHAQAPDDGSLDPTAPEQAPGRDSASGDSTSGDSMASASAPAKRGFAAMDEATQRGIASKGGQSQGKENNPGNFANDRERAREAGRKGGESHGSNRSLS